MPSVSEYLGSLAAAVVTGGSSGIGSCLIGRIRSVSPAVRVCNLSRTEGPPGLALDLRVDLADGGETVRAAGRVADWLRAEVPPGRVLLVNNAGFGSLDAFPQPGPERMAAMVEVNAAAPVRLTAALLPELRARGGAILNVASTAAFQPLPGMAVYAASKAFLLHWSLALGEELRGGGVHVLALCPGPVPTRFAAAAGLAGPLPGPGWLAVAPEVVVDRALRGLAAGRPLVACGRRAALLAMISGRLPRVWAARLGGAALASVREAAGRARPAGGGG